MSNYTLICGDALETLRGMEAHSVSAIVCDPPYGLSFMGKAWDHGVPGAPFWEAALKVAKPGAHLLAFGGTRTHHRLMCAIEDAGWEIRDVLSWNYGSGFPKSANVSKMIDKAAGAEREVVGYRTSAFGTDTATGERASRANGEGGAGLWGGSEAKEVPLTGAPATDAARTWDGWGTALKPAWEPIILARAPLSEPTIAQNVLRWGTGALNIDATRIPSSDVVGASGRWGFTPDKGWNANGVESKTSEVYEHTNGRWPPNLCLDPEAAALLDQMSGELSRSSTTRRKRNGPKFNGKYNGGKPGVDPNITHSADGYGDVGGASRFFPIFANDDDEPLRMFYAAKASKRDRDEGLEGMPERDKKQVYGNGLNSATKCDPKMHTPEGVAARPKALNVHPTVKPTPLMRWLVRLITPPGGTVLDPFAGSGSTLKAAILEGFDCIGIDNDAEYVELARARCAHAAAQYAAAQAQPLLLEAAG